MNLTVTHKNIHFLQELAIRITLFIIYWITDDAEPFRRPIQPEEWWLYNYARTNSIYPVRLLYVTIIGVPLFVLTVFYFQRRDKQDYMEAGLGVSLSVTLAICVTNVLKLFVGRPRPDFLHRCFPDGKIVTESILHCTGDENIVREGYKSFPSGHSTFAFSSLGYVGLYLMGKLRVFNSSGRNSSWKLLCIVVPFLWATLIAVSRTEDFHHHWQDVLCGSLLGMMFAYVCYHQGYPSVSRLHSHLTYLQLASISQTDIEMGPLLPGVAGSKRQIV